MISWWLNGAYKLGDVDAARVHPGALARQVRVDAESVRSRMPMWCVSMQWSMPLMTA